VKVEQKNGAREAGGPIAFVKKIVQWPLKITQNVAQPVFVNFNTCMAFHENTIE
jgi:hypothetical protein